MVTITEDAAVLITRIQSGAENSPTLRVIVEGGELVIGNSEAAQDDEVYFHEGSPVLRLTLEAAGALAGCTIDAEQTSEGPSLAIIQPGEESQTA